MQDKMSYHTDCEDPKEHLEDWAKGFNPNRKPVDWEAIQRELEERKKRGLRLVEAYRMNPCSKDLRETVRLTYYRNLDDEVRIAAGRALGYSRFRVGFKEFFRLMFGAGGNKMAEKWHQDSYKRNKILENIGIPIFCVAAAAGGGAVFGGIAGSAFSGFISPTHAAYERMRAEENNCKYYKPAGKPGYIKKGAIIGAEAGAGLSVLVLGILAANEIKNRIKR